MKFASEFRSSVPQKAVAMFPKRSVNYNKCEITRFAKMTINSIEYLSFYVPKRVTYYLIFRTKDSTLAFMLTALLESLHLPSKNGSKERTKNLLPNPLIP